jgi:hypothetical protein
LKSRIKQDAEEGFSSSESHEVSPTIVSPISKMQNWLETLVGRRW